MSSNNLKIRHQRSAQDYPELSLQASEHVELEFTRAAICTVLLWIVAAFAAVLLTVFLIIFNNGRGDSFFGNVVDAKSFINAVGLVLYAVIIIIPLVASKVFNANRLYITNRRAIQNTCISLFGHSVNTIELTKIEDVSFKQSGVFQYLFGIGTIRLSTVGDETTYTFKYAYKPTTREMNTLTKLVIDAKEDE